MNRTYLVRSNRLQLFQCSYLSVMINEELEIYPVNQNALPIPIFVHICNYIL